MLCVSCEVRTELCLWRRFNSPHEFKSWQSRRLVARRCSVQISTRHLLSLRFIRFSLGPAGQFRDRSPITLQSFPPKCILMTSQTRLVKLLLLLLPPPPPTHYFLVARPAGLMVIFSFSHGCKGSYVALPHSAFRNRRYVSMCLCFSKCSPQFAKDAKGFLPHWGTTRLDAEMNP
jgi:hypothetical protein